MPGKRKKTSIQKDVKNTMAIKTKIGHKIHQKKLFLVHNSTENLYARKKAEEKILERDTPQA